MTEVQTLLAYIGKIEDHNERYCLTEQSVKSPSSCTFQGHTYTIRMNEELKSGENSKLTKVFCKMREDLSSRLDQDYDTDEVVAAWNKLRQKYEGAKKKYLLTTNPFTRFFLKLWSWLSGAPTLNSSFHSLSHVLMKMCQKQVIGNDNSHNKHAIAGILHNVSVTQSTDRLFYGHALRFLAKEIDPVLMLKQISFALTQIQALRQVHLDEEEKLILDALMITLQRLQGKEKNQLKKVNAITLMLFAIEYNHLGLAKKLLNDLLSLDIQCKDMILGEFLLAASARGNQEMFQLFLRKNTHLNIADKKKGKTALHYAVENGHGNIARTLVAAGAKKDVPDNSHKTPADYANTPELIKLFSQ